MLDKAHRLTSAHDYKRVVRRGRRTVGANTVTYMTMNPDGGTPRFGFIVAKTVGGAVIRNSVRRRLKASAYAIAQTLPAGTDVVIRALPPASTATYGELCTELARATAGLATR